MDAGLWLQYGVIAMAVLASVAYVLHRQLPGFTRRLRLACALPLVREHRPRWLRAIGRWIAPRSSAAGGACGGCDSCSPGG